MKMKFIYYDGAYFRPEAVAMISEDKDYEGACIVHLFGGQKICLPCHAKYAADIIADVADGNPDIGNPDIVNEQMDWHEMG